MDKKIDLPKTNNNTDSPRLSTIKLPGKNKFKKNNHKNYGPKN
jgi:hypothetical protein